MRDPNQLELNFDQSTYEPTTQEQDAAVQARLERQRVLTHLNAIARGHKTWSNLNAPKTDELVRYGQYLLDNPQDIGNQYDVILKAELDERIQVMIHNMPVVDFKPEVMERIQVVRAQ